MAPPDPLKRFDLDQKGKFPEVTEFRWEPAYRGERLKRPPPGGLGGEEGAPPRAPLRALAQRLKRPPPGGLCGEEGPPRGPPYEQDSKSSPLLPPDLLKTLADFEEEEELVFAKPPDFFQAMAGPLSSAPGPNLFLANQSRMESCPEASLLPVPGFPMQEFSQNSIFSQAYGKAPPPRGPEGPPGPPAQEPSLYSLFEGTPWSPSLPASSDHSTPASQSPHSSNPSSLPSSPPTHSHGGALPFSNFGPIGTPDSRDRRAMDRWKPDKPGAVGSFGLDYLPASVSSSAADSGWHQAGAAGSSWTNQESPMEESSSTALLEGLKSIWSGSMLTPGPSALEQLLLQQKQKQRGGAPPPQPPTLTGGAPPPQPPTLTWGRPPPPPTRTDPPDPLTKPGGPPPHRASWKRLL
ncbi:nonsense-mediated mRNA decay factor SMG7-like [Menidia menidia]